MHWKIAILLQYFLFLIVWKRFKKVSKYLLLNQACGGNPLEAGDIIIGFLRQKEAFEDYLESYLDYKAAKISDLNQYFLQSRDADFSKRFHELLMYLDTEVSVVGLDVEDKVLETIDRRYMFLNPETNFLESVLPAAAYLFSEMRISRMK